MKIFKTANYKQTMQEISYQEIFNESIVKNNGDERKAAEEVLDLITSGVWAVWDQERIDKGIKTILNQFSSKKTIASKKIEIAGKKEKGKKDGTGPFEDSFQNKKYEKGKRKKRRKIAQVRPNPLDGKSNQQAKVIVNRKIIPQDKIKGFFSDDSWQGVQQIWNAFSEAGLDWNLNGSDYYPTNEGQPMGGKIWKIEINFTNNKGKLTTLYGTVTAAGAGTREDPLSRYDITAYVG